MKSRMTEQNEVEIVLTTVEARELYLALLQHVTLEYLIFGKLISAIVCHSELEIPKYLENN